VVGKDVLYFLNPELATDHSIPRTQKFVKRIGGHAFYK
jgi:spore germination cell wall hydrolase CwlJ-like protein